MVEILRMLRQAGHQVVLMFVHRSEARYQVDVEETGVECVYDKDRRLWNWEAMEDFAREGKFVVAVLLTYGIFNQYEYPLRKALPSCALVLDTVDLHSVRSRREAELLGGAERNAEAEKVEKEEWAAVRDADAVWVVTSKEKDIVAQRGTRVVDIVPNIHTMPQEVPSWRQREGIVFLGGYVHLPNVDAVCWFVAEIWPLVRTELPDVALTLAGSNPPDAVLQLNNLESNVHVVGFAKNHRQLLLHSRVAIAPLRYGAGMKGKIGEYLCCGLPCVTTSIGAEGMGFTSGEHIALTDDPAQFACEVVRLYHNQNAWCKMSEAGRSFMRQYTIEAVRPRLLTALNRAGRERCRRNAWWRRVGRLMLTVRPKHLC